MGRMSRRIQRHLSPARRREIPGWRAGLRSFSRRLLGWVEASRIERVAAANAADAFPGTAPGAVFLDGFDEVFAATGVEAANGGAERAHEGLVAADHSDQHQGQ